ncbi:hypothetical protein EDD22DRAFT_1050829 [Suillus occidentalis]|nr:hypothetical protein EDD22DRAFT_1050829 [Suillus occidentalis]
MYAFSESAPSTSLPSRSAFVNPTRSSSRKGKLKADAVGVDDGYRPYVVFFCLSWFQKKKKKPEPQPVVYDDEFDGDDEEEENVPVVVPPPSLRVQHEEIELKPMASQSQPEAGPSRLAPHMGDVFLSKVRLGTDIKIICSRHVSQSSIRVVTMSPQLFNSYGISGIQDAVVNLRSSKKSFTDKALLETYGVDSRHDSQPGITDERHHHQTEPHHFHA